MDSEFKLSPQSSTTAIAFRSVLPQGDLQGRLRQGQRVLHGAGRVLVQARLHRPHLHRVPALPGLRQRILRETLGMHVSVRVCIYLTAMRVQWSNRKKGFSLTDSNKSERNHSSSFCSCEPGFGGKLCNRPVNAANPANFNNRQQPPIRASKSF